MRRGRRSADTQTMTSSASHAFRYEPALCSLAEGQVLNPQRRAEDPQGGRSPRAALRRLGLLRTADRRGGER
jgi:hypothetical protein